MLGQHLVLVTLHRGLYLILSKIIKIVDTKYHNLNSFNFLLAWSKMMFYRETWKPQVPPLPFFIWRTSYVSIITLRWGSWNINCQPLTELQWNHPWGKTMLCYGIHCTFLRVGSRQIHQGTTHMATSHGCGSPVLQCQCTLPKRGPTIVGMNFDQVNALKNRL